MKDIFILKLGGSVLTDKKASKPILKINVIKQIAEEITRSQVVQKKIGLILLYGGGSFGHPLARRYKLSKQPLTQKTLLGVGHTITAMRELGTCLSSLFLDAGLTVIPLQTSSFVEERRGQLYFKNFKIIKTILKHGGIPLFGGDVVFSDKNQSLIASADHLAVLLAKHLQNSTLLFATDTNGVYARFPPQIGECQITTLDRKETNKILLRKQSTNKKYDVTGAMPGKLRSLLKLRNMSVVIFNGNLSGNLLKALTKKEVGTLIKL